jgi:ankyrin repeat protein
MYEREHDVLNATNDTCTWLSRNSTYLQWLNQQPGLLWIKGHPGVGKSTLMKPIIRDAEKDENIIVVSFFFHARGTSLQHNISGLYRCLLHTIMKRIPDLCNKIASVFTTKCQTLGKHKIDWDWNQNELQELFVSHVVKAAKTYQIRVYIDALDECGEEAAVDLVGTFQRMANFLWICFSCRHYPLIALEDGLEICVEKNNAQDIQTYLQHQLDDIRYQKQILDKASGNFQWVKLVTDQVRHWIRRGKPPKAIQNMITSLPVELSRLYEGFLANIDDSDTWQSLKLFQWILFAVRPLTLRELRFAMVVDEDTTYLSIQECKESELYVDTDEAMEKRVRDLSQGLAEVVCYEESQDEESQDEESQDEESQDEESQDEESQDEESQDEESQDEESQDEGSQDEESQDEESQDEEEQRRTRKIVQLIHQSVNDFLLEKGIQILHESQGRSLNGTVIGCSHFRLSRSCLKYLSMYEIRDLSLKTDDSMTDYEVLPWKERRRRIKKLCTDEFPFLEYATVSWISHAAIVEKENIPQTDLVSYFHPNFQSSPSLLNSWSAMSNIIEEYTFSYAFSYPLNTTLMHIAARQCFLSVFNYALSQDIRMDCIDEEGRTPLHYAAERGHETIVNGLLNLDEVATNSRDKHDDTPLGLAAEWGHETVVKLLLQRDDVKTNSRYKYGLTPLALAAENGHETVVKLLLQLDDVTTNSKDDIGDTPLARAAGHGQETVVKLLLQRDDVKTNCKNNFGDTALARAAKNGHEAVVKLLLLRDDVMTNFTNEFGDTPLALAAKHGHEAVVRLLLERDEVKADQEDISRSLELAYEKKHESVARILEQSLSQFPNTSVEDERMHPRK